MSKFSHTLLNSINAYVDATVVEPFKALKMPSSKYHEADFKSHSFSLIEMVKKQKQMCSPEIRGYSMRRRRSLRDDYLKSLQIVTNKPYRA